MQFARCFVQIGGDLGTRIAKAPVSPAEVVVLRAIHGNDSINGLELINGGLNDKTPHAEEMRRLRDSYTATTEDGIPVIDKIFPGHSPQLPTTFREIGVDLADAAVAPAQKTADTNGDGQLSTSELKAELTRLGVPFKGNASKASLGALYEDALDAMREPMRSSGADGDADESED